MDSSNPSDQFAILLLAPLEQGVQVWATNDGWDTSANGFYTQDAATDPGSDWNGNAYQAHVSFTPATEQPAGTVLTSAVFTDVLPFQTSADQLLVYTGSLSSPTFICALDLAKGYNGYGGDDCKGGTTLSVWPTNVECTGYGSQEKYKYFSELPSGLTAGESALRIEPDDNVAYAGSTTSGSPSALRTAIAVDTDWDKDDWDSQTFVTSFTVTAPEPSLPPSSPPVPPAPPLPPKAPVYPLKLATARTGVPG